MGPQWEQPTFGKRTSREPSDGPRFPLWGKITAAAAGIALAVTGFSLLGQHANSEPADSPSPTISVSYKPETPSPLPSVSESSQPTTTPSHSTNPTPDAPSATLPSVSSLKGNVGYIPRDKSSGFLWGRAVWSDKTNIMVLKCHDDTPSVQLNVVDENDVITKQYENYAYPEASPNPCVGDTVGKSIKQTGKTLGYYSLLLSASIANGTLG